MITLLYRACGKLVIGNNRHLLRASIRSQSPRFQIEILHSTQMMISEQISELM